MISSHLHFSLFGNPRPGKRAVHAHPPANSGIAPKTWIPVAGQFSCQVECPVQRGKVNGPFDLAIKQRSCGKRGGGLLAIHAAKHFIIAKLGCALLTGHALFGI